MANLLKDYDTFAVPLRIPIHGKEYIIPAVGAADGIMIHRAIDGDEDALAVLNDGITLRRMVLGAAYDLMLADNVPGPAMDRAEVAALADFKHGRIAAQMAWETGQDPEAVAAIMAATQAILQTR